MTASRKFCPHCGAPRDPSSKFCKKCGMKFDEKSTAEQAYETARGVATTAKSVESTVSQAGEAVRTAGQVKEILGTPRAQWKVVIGEHLPGIGGAAVTTATEMVQQKAKDAVSAKVEDMVKDTLAKPREQGAGKAAPAKPPVSGQVCPACGNPVKAGAKFCGSCGATIGTIQQSVSHLCPHCGFPVRPGAKFCGTCGKKTV